MTEKKKSSALMIVVAWILVGLPAGWGVYNTVMNSMKLFRKPPAVQVSPAGQK